MEYKRESNGWLTLLEQGWFIFPVLPACLLWQALQFFLNLSAARWIWCYGIALLISAAGLSLLVYSKFPLFRQGRFFTFGSNPLSPRGRLFYRWGYGFVIFGAAILLGLLISGLSNC